MYINVWQIHQMVFAIIIKINIKLRVNHLNILEQQSQQIFFGNINPSCSLVHLSCGIILLITIYLYII